MSEFLKDYQDGLNHIINELVPEQTSKGHVCNLAQPWFDADLRDQKIKVHNPERCWKKYRQNHHWEALKMERSKYMKMIHAVRSEFYHSKFKLQKGDSKELYKLVSRLTGTIMENKLLDHDSNDAICEELADFLLNKIARIRGSLSGYGLYKCKTSDVPFPMSDFVPMDNNSVHKAVSKLHSKSCELDIISTKLVKAHLDYIIDAYTKIVNLLLKTDEFYDDWKSAILRPLQKKKGFDMSNVNYRPVGNLPFLLKLVEKCVLIQFNNHLKLNTLNVEHQSSYKEGHNCETLLMKIHNDILWAMEHQCVNAMIFLDLSAAFYMVDHSVLVNILKNKYGINDLALSWFKNYLQDHRFHLVVEDMIS